MNQSASARVAIRKEPLRDRRTTFHDSFQDLPARDAQACAAVLTLKAKDTKDVTAGTLADSGAAEVTFEIGRRELKTLERKAERRGSVNLRIKGTFSDSDGSIRSRVKLSLG